MNRAIMQLVLYAVRSTQLNWHLRAHWPLVDAYVSIA